MHIQWHTWCHVIRFASEFAIVFTFAIEFMRLSGSVGWFDF